MRPSPRSRLFAGSFASAAALLFLGFLPAASAQKPAGPPAPNQAPFPRKPVITNENLPYTVLAKADHPSGASVPQPVSTAQPSAATPEEVARRAAEIASLQKQIKEKQKRIELLMHLFVTDEKKFVQFSGDLELDPEVQARIRDEQEELRRESAACAQLQARLEALQGSSSAPALH